jgi:hypothetical protein
VPRSSFGILDNNGREENPHLNLGSTENTLSQVMETQMTVNDNEFYSFVFK